MATRFSHAPGNRVRCSSYRWDCRRRIGKNGVQGQAWRGKDRCRRRDWRRRQNGGYPGRYVIAQHVDPTQPVGTIAINAGPCSGGVDSWFGVIKGKGGHGAYPHNTVDPFFLIAQVIIALNGIVSRRLDPFAPAVVSIGSLNGGFTENVIPDSIKITGTLRFTTPEVQKQIHDEIKRAFEVAKALGGDYELKIEIGAPPMINNEYVSNIIHVVGKELLGTDNVQELHKTLGAEDFGSFMNHAPGAMYTLGTQKKGHENYLLHHPKFDLDERALPIGTAMLAETAMRFLKE